MFFFFVVFWLGKKTRGGPRKVQSFEAEDVLT